MTSHKNLLRHLLMARSNWIEERVVALASVHGYPYVTTAMNRLFAHLGGRPVGLSELARRLSVSRQAVHKTASEAEKLGLVEFVPDESDKRVMLLRFTQKGWRMSESAAASFKDIEQELAGHIGADNVEALRRILSLPWPGARSHESPSQPVPADVAAPVSAPGPRSGDTAPPGPRSGAHAPRTARKAR